MAKAIEEKYLLELTPSELTLLWSQMQALGGLNEHVFEFHVLKNKIAKLWDILNDQNRGTDGEGS